jgi:hypothetical protein
MTWSVSSQYGYGYYGYRYFTYVIKMLDCLSEEQEGLGFRLSSEPNLCILL